LITATERAASHDLENHYKQVWRKKVAPVLALY
jgi:hypothetical protein